MGGKEQTLICRLVAYGAEPAGSRLPRPLPHEGRHGEEVAPCAAHLPP